MTDDGQETVACLYRKICNLCKGMRFGCAAAYIICLVLQHFALHMATWPDAVHNVSLCRQLRFPFLLEVFEDCHWFYWPLPSPRQQSVKIWTDLQPVVVEVPAAVPAEEGPAEEVANPSLTLDPNH